MLAALSTLFSGLFGWLSGLLPNSPFAGLHTITSNMALGLGWLNWLIDLNGCVAVLELYLAAAFAITVVRILIRRASGFVDKGINWNGGYTE